MERTILVINHEIIKNQEKTRFYSIKKKKAHISRIIRCRKTTRRRRKGKKRKEKRRGL